MALTDRSAAWPWKNGRPPHLPMPDPVPKAFLLPGDPARVDMASEVLTGFRIIGQNREFRLGVGQLDGVLIGVCSTGVGGASAEITAVELAALGATCIIRTGGCGALADDLALGDFLVIEETPRHSGVAAIYAPDPAAPVRADPAVTRAIDGARLSLGLAGRIGRCITADGYYRAQGRPIRADGAGDSGLLDRLRAAGADGVEMEAEVIFAVAAASGIQAGAVLAVHAHRRSDGWLEDYERTQRDLIRIGAMAAVTLTNERRNG